MFSLYSCNLFAGSEDKCKELFDKHSKAYFEGNYVEALKLLSAANELAAKESNWIELNAKIQNSYGMIYMKSSDHRQAIKCFLEAYRLVKDGDFKKTEISVLNNIARLYFFDKKLENAVEFLAQAIQLAQSIGDTIYVCRMGINIAIIYHELGEFELAEQHLHQAIDVLEKDSALRSPLQSAQIEYLHNLCLQKKYKQAESFALKTLSQYDEDIPFPLKSFCYLYLSQAEGYQKKYQQAIEHAYMGIPICVDIATKIKIYNQLVELYASLKMYNKVVECQDSLIVCKDILLRKNDEEKALNLEARLGLHRSEDELLLQQTQRKRERMVYGLLILAILIGVWALRTHFKRQKEQKALELEKTKNAKLLLEGQLREKEIEEIRLNNEIILKTKQLSSQVLVQLHKNELTAEIIETLSNIPDTTELKRINSIINQLKQQIKENSDWESFLTYFDQINPKLLSNLREKYGEFTIGELRMVAYISLGMDTKEISRLFSITDEHCRKKRQRLAKKLGVTTIEIRGFLNKIGERGGN